MPAYGRKLFGVFDDPRVVDRKLQLEEQAAYERTHTIEEVRREHYGHEPLGDERDSLFPVEITGKSSTDSEFFEDTPAENDTAQTAGGDNVSMKAALDDLAKWRRMALRGKALKASGFKSAYIPRQTVAQIKRDLLAAKGQDDIAVIFDMAADGMKPKPKRQNNDMMTKLVEQMERQNQIAIWKGYP